jgi:hypothetical protein
VNGEAQRYVQRYFQWGWGKSQFLKFPMFHMGASCKDIGFL